MSRNKWLLTVVAFVLIICSGVGIAYAYFTTYAEAKGGYVIKAGPDIEDRYVEGVKHVVITNSEGASPIFVRAQVFYADQYEQYVSVSGTNWQQEGNWYYYTLPVEGAGKTEELLAKIDGVPDYLVEGDNFNIIVVYEYVLAVYDSNGTPSLKNSWAHGQINTNVNGSSEGGN